MLIRRPPDIAPSEITDCRIYEGRRDFIKTAGLGLAAALLPAAANPARAARYSGLLGHPSSVRDEKLTPLQDVISYNNFYEFGYNKSAPMMNAGAMKTRPWTVTIDGLVKKPRQFGMEEILRLSALEERIFRLRCVEAWSMVVPWVGFSLSHLLKQVEPLGNARYVAFQTKLDRDAMPGVSLPYLSWPYTEGLRLDEAMHPLTTLVVGLYGEELPNQNGAPLRVVIPWKYGFKGPKSIVRISFMEQPPVTAWNRLQPDEYGFFANVNPTVDHPRWSQSRERRIGEFFRRPTLMFNGYADQVASLYTGMDLKKYY